MHKGGNKLNLNLNIDGLFLQETCTNTETQFSHAPYWPGAGRLGGDQVNTMMGYESKSVF